MEHLYRCQQRTWSSYSAPSAEDLLLSKATTMLEVTIRGERMDFASMYSGPCDSIVNAMSAYIMGSCLAYQRLDRQSHDRLLTLELWYLSIGSIPHGAAACSIFHRAAMQHTSRHRGELRGERSSSSDATNRSGLRSSRSSPRVNSLSVQLAVSF